MENYYLMTFKICVTHLILTGNHVILITEDTKGRSGSACKYIWEVNYGGCNQNRM